MIFKIPENFNPQWIMNSISFSGIKFYTKEQFEKLNIDLNSENSEPKELSQREEHKEKSIFEQALDYLNTINTWKNNKELATEIYLYFIKNKDKKLSWEDIPEIYNLIKKELEN